MIGGREKNKGCEVVEQRERRKGNTFIVTVLDEQNSTWQGKINWVEEKKEQHFRSALEMLKLMDEALGSGEDKKSF